MVELQQESRHQKLVRKSTNAWTKIVGVCMMSEVIAKMKTKELKIKVRKQQFGQQYLDFLQQNASEETLNRCLCLAREDIAAIQRKLDVLQQRKETIRLKTKCKVLHRPDRWDSEKTRTKMMEPLMLTEPTEVLEVFFDEVDSDFVAYATAVHSTAGQARK